MRSLFTTILLLSFFTVISALCDTLYVLQTTDVHGHIYPYDYLKETDAPLGLARISTAVEKYRTISDKVILIDCGDMLQGTPLTDYHHKFRSSDPEPMIRVMNAMKYDAFAVGNHDIEQGPGIFEPARKISDFPWLSANSTLADGSTFFDPYTFLDYQGIRVAVLGLTTPGVPRWMDSSFYPGITWECMIEASRKFLPELALEADLIIGAFHAGFTDRTEAFGENVVLENASAVVADLVPGFDLILGGHTHRILPLEPVNADTDGVLKMNSGSRGRYLGVAEIVYELNDEDFTLISKKAWLETMTDHEPDPEILEIASEYHRNTMDYINTELIRTDQFLTTSGARFSDNGLIDLIQQVQIEASDAELSFTSCFDNSISIKDGVIRVKDIYQLYPYPNFLYTARMTSEEIIAYLEHSSRYYTVSDGEISSNPQIAGYNLDFAEGIYYEIDPSASPGSRITFIEFPAESVPDQEYYKVAINSFRASGGGGFLEAAGIDSLEIITRSTRDIPDLITDYLRKQNGIIFQASNNWIIKGPDQ